jgi:hypothetical protein
LQHYHRAMDICRQVYGDFSLLTSRLYINIGIVYEDNSDYVCAFDYFTKWARVCETVLGPEHPKTRRAKGVLKEPRYSLVAERLKQLDDQQRESNNTEENVLTVAGINSEVDRLAAREVRVFSFDRNRNDEFVEHNESEGEALQVSEDLQQAINDLLQRALSELEMREQQADSLLGRVEQEIEQTGRLRVSLNLLDAREVDANILSENLLNLSLNNVEEDDPETDDDDS